MATNKVYTVHYKLYGDASGEKYICVLAHNKEEAYDKAFFEEIPKLTGEHAYSAWVVSVTYQNGNCRYFNTCEGLPY